MSLLLTVIRAAIRALFVTKQALLLENLALRQQLAAYRRASERARLRPQIGPSGWDCRGFGTNGSQRS